MSVGKLDLSLEVMAQRCRDILRDDAPSTPELMRRRDELAREATRNAELQRQLEELEDAPSPDATPVPKYEAWSMQEPEVEESPIPQRDAKLTASPTTFSRVSALPPPPKESADDAALYRQLIDAEDVDAVLDDYVQRRSRDRNGGGPSEAHPVSAPQPQVESKQTSPQPSPRRVKADPIDDLDATRHRSPLPPPDVHEGDLAATRRMSPSASPGRGQRRQQQQASSGRLGPRSKANDAVRYQQLPWGEPSLVEPMPSPAAHRVILAPIKSPANNVVRRQGDKGTTHTSPAPSPQRAASTNPIRVLNDFVIRSHDDKPSFADPSAGVHQELLPLDDTIRGEDPTNRVSAYGAARATTREPAKWFDSQQASPFASPRVRRSTAPIEVEEFRRSSPIVSGGEEGDYFEDSPPRVVLHTARNEPFGGSGGSRARSHGRSVTPKRARFAVPEVSTSSRRRAAEGPLSTSSSYSYTYSSGSDSRSFTDDDEDIGIPIHHRRAPPQRRQTASPSSQHRVRKPRYPVKHVNFSPSRRPLLESYCDVIPRKQFHGQLDEGKWMPPPPKAAASRSTTPPKELPRPATPTEAAAPEEPRVEEAPPAVERKVSIADFPPPPPRQEKVKSGCCS